MTLVPGWPLRPSERYHAAPRRTIWGTEAKVSTLLTAVGKSSKPCVTGKGGRLRG